MKRRHLSLAAYASLLATVGCGARKNEQPISVAPPLRPAAPVYSAPPAAISSSASAVPVASAPYVYAPPAEPGPLVEREEAPFTTNLAGCHSRSLRGWHRLSFEQKCGFAIPGSSADLPPPIVWELCSAGLGFLKGSCR